MTLPTHHTVKLEILNRRNSVCFGDMSVACSQCSHCHCVQHSQQRAIIRALAAHNISVQTA